MKLTVRQFLGGIDRRLEQMILDLIKRKRHVPMGKTDADVMHMFGESFVQSDEVADMVNVFKICASDADPAQIKHHLKGLRMVGEAKMIFDSLEKKDDGPHLVTTTSLPPARMQPLVNAPASGFISSHYTHPHWARGTASSMVDICKAGYGTVHPALSAIDDGSEISILSKSFWEKTGWPIIMNHGWGLRGATNHKSKLYGALPSVKVSLHGIDTVINLFVQEDAPNEILLGENYCAEALMETQHLEDGSKWARIYSPNKKDSVGFSIIPVNHPRNQRNLFPASKENF